MGIFWFIIIMIAIIIALIFICGGIIFLKILFGLIDLFFPWLVGIIAVLFVMYLLIKK